MINKRGFVSFPILIGILVLIGAVSIGGYFVVKNVNNAKNISQANLETINHLNSQEDNRSITGQLISSTSSKFYTYINKRLGFQVNIPKTYRVSCVPIDPKCDNLSVRIAESENKVEFSNWPFEIVNSIYTDQDVNNLFKNKFGNQCTVTKNPSTQEGVFDIKEAASCISGPEGGAYSKILYYPKEGKILFVAFMLEPQFYESIDPLLVYDEAVIDSIKFLTP